jgi:hypothetical protein
VAVASLAVLVRIAGWLSPGLGRVEPSPVPSWSARPNPCPPGTLPDGHACVPVGVARLEAPGAWAVPDRIPKGPDRLLDLDAYRLPVSPSLRVLFGPNDLGQPELVGPGPAAHAGIDLAGQRGAEVRLVRLLHQSADAELLEVGNHGGWTVVTLHETGGGREPGSYLLIHGELGQTPPGLERGIKLGDGALLGWVGDSGRAGLCRVHFDVRRLRDGVDAHREPIDKLVQDALSFSTDPRNVLPLRSPAGSANAAPSGH